MILNSTRQPLHARCQRFSIRRLASFSATNAPWSKARLHPTEHPNSLPVSGEGAALRLSPGLARKVSLVVRFPESRYNSSRLPGGGLALASFFPLERRQLGYLAVGSCGQALQDVFEVSTGLDPMHRAVLDQREHSRIL